MSGTAIHHVIPASVLERYASFFQANYGPSAAAAFGMTSDFKDRLSSTGLSNAYAAEGGQQRLIELPTARARDGSILDLDTTTGHGVVHNGPHSTYTSYMDKSIKAIIDANPLANNCK